MDKDIDRTSLAEQCQVSRRHIDYIFQGLRRPSPTLALKIEQATGGAVTRMELLYPEDTPPKVDQEAA
jgi:DNA-binding transcriptional regulator YdaS (Cro superfamily)